MAGDRGSQLIKDKVSLNSFAVFSIQSKDEIGLKEWLHSLRTAHKGSVELLANMARKAGKIYGTDMDANNRQHTQHNSPLASRSTNGT